ncbi:metal ABC transporter substrate-binding protein [Vagococcus humatus]|uniref:Zinc ABC transporter substrate-binding protein n=1 Tax=Vagococcus humatus TaxID=1889241 RepID=A0A3S0GE92_9ENTE|nr:metal ABC transporter substrate-binding protein [Vagococcus humatus]RST89775.1 zinc ABC transporter substrate-binding protein [Vagococcus humatus]
MKRKKRYGVILSLLALFILASCGQKEKETSSSHPSVKVVTTFYPMYDFTKQVVGEEGEVSMLIKGSVEPHDYEPSPKDIAKIQQADVFVYNSKEMETWVPSVLASIDKSQVKVIEASQGISLAKGSDSLEEEADHAHAKDHHHEYDPHVWLDPVLAKQEVQQIRDGLKSVSQLDQSVLTTQAKAYEEKLTQLDQAYQTAFKGATQRVFVTQHAAFGYLAKRYNLTQLPIAGISPDQEPSPASLAKMEKFVKENQVNIIYTEALSSSKVAKTISEATGAELKELSTLESLSAKENKQGLDYLKIMEQNLTALKESIH